MGNPTNAPCDHGCLDKEVCEHKCCKSAAEMPAPPQQSTATDPATPKGWQDRLDALNSQIALGAKVERGEHVAAAAHAEHLLLNPHAIPASHALCHIIIAHDKQGAARKAHILAARDLFREYLATCDDQDRLSVMSAMLACEVELAHT
ncbi:unnamed protein product [Zymoseptoria tritici ST99CH_1A5]|uniref:Uncharacterized protein n=2 Tax=Zymoseptoria tritici TaxID=1047171 RepID=A0A2H1GBM6_ZYMTR|nr:unnamed protein product [Zymoseptoria tritici ST99CH_1E4]SMR51901.1 unnamed protein product [Zymoseptoria tritici ST99CH_3D1]SMY23654.1 unnamed protein product [Zymoseptoria tritici ST99CH_1A5]